jgi:hypothetical protein
MATLPKERIWKVAELQTGPGKSDRTIKESNIVIMLPAGEYISSSLRRALVMVKKADPAYSSPATFQQLTIKLLNMKKLFFILIACLSLCSASIGQIKEISGDNLTKTINDVTFFSESNLRGTQGKAYYRVGVFKFPFENKKSISFKVTSGKIAYVKFCNDIPVERAFTGNVASIDLTYICGLRIDDIQDIGVSFAGISTDVCNNDCKNVFGSVKVKLVEKAPDGTDCYLTLTDLGIPNKTEFTAFDKPTLGERNRYRNYVFNNNPIPAINIAVTVNNIGDECLLPVGKTAIRDGRVRMVIVSNIKSAHKSGDVASDYCSNVHMDAPVTKIVPINYLYDGDKLVNAANPRLIVGPFRATGNPDNGVLANAGILKNFRAHFIVFGL